MPPTVTVLPKGNPYFFFFFQKFLWEYGLFALTEQQSNSSFQSFSFFFFFDDCQQCKCTYTFSCVFSAITCKTKPKSQEFLREL